MGYDDAVLECRGAAACSSRRVRPDAYFVYRQAGRAYGFFHLESVSPSTAE